jgi:hypothetical protein
MSETTLLEMTLPYTMQIKDINLKGKKIAIECPLEIDHSEVPITCPNAENSANQTPTSILALPCKIIVPQTMFMHGVYYLWPSVFACMEYWDVSDVSTIFSCLK